MRRKKKIHGGLSQNVLKRCSTVLILLMMLQNAAWANPLGPKVVKGKAAVSGVGTGQVVIHQTTPKAVLTWQQFNIAPNEVTRFIQPGKSSIALNRILDANPSKIFGSLQANGSVILLNPNGVMFGPNAQVNVGGLIASSLNMTDENFLSGRYLFQGNTAAGPVTNAGTIESGPGGFVYLFAPNVKNSGVIKSPEGHIVLAAGTTAYLSERPDGLGFLVEVKNPGGEAANLKDLVADGGSINLYGRVVNQEGLVRADSVREKEGRIELFASEKMALANGSVISAKGSDQGVSNGGTVVVLSDKTQGATRFDPGAVIDISGGAQGGNGGSAEVSGHEVALGGAVLGGAAPGYRGGSFLLDPYDLTVDLPAFYALIDSGLTTIEFQADHDLDVYGVIADLSTLPVAPGASGELIFEAGNDLRFTDTLIVSGLFDFQSDASWNVTATAGRDILLSNSLLGTGKGGNLTLRAERNIVAPNTFNSSYQLYTGLRLDADVPGILTIDAGGDFTGGFVLSSGQAHVDVGGNFGAAGNYANLTLGKGQIDVAAGGSIYLGLVQDKGLSEGTNPVLTADPNNAVNLAAANGDIHLRPILSDGTAINDLAQLRQYYPATFVADASNGSIFVESNLTFWPSPTGSIKFSAQGSIKGIPINNVSQGGNCGLPGTPACGPPGTPGNNVPQQTVNTVLPSVKLIPADPNILAGRQSGELSQAVLNTPSANISGDVIPVTFKTAAGDISNLVLDLYSPTLRKQAAIESARDITQFIATISVPEAVRATVSAARNIDMTPTPTVTLTGGTTSGLHFLGTGNALVSTGGDLNLSTSQGIDQKLFKDITSDSIPRGLLEIAVGGNLAMTKSSIVTYSGAAIQIHGVAGPGSPVGGIVDIGVNQKTVPVFNSYQGVMTFRGGQIDIIAAGDVNVNTSRVATFGGSDINIVSTQGAINAGFGGAGQKVGFAFPEGTDSQGNTISKLVYVPGSGIFTFSPLDPFPLPILRAPFTGFPQVKTLFLRLIKLRLLGHNTEKLAADFNGLFAETRADFINTMQLGNIALQAIDGAIIVPKGGIRGKSLSIEAKVLDLQGGSLSGDVSVDVDQVAGNPSAINGGFFGGTVGGVTAAPTSGAGLVSLSGSTSSLSTSTATTTASVSTSAEAAAEETVAESDRGAERTQAGAKEAENAKGKRNRKTVQSLNFKKGVTIQVDVSDN